MSNLWKWLKGPFWTFVRGHWQIILAVVATLAALWAGKRVVSLVGNLLNAVAVPKAQSPVPFAVIDKTHLSVHQADGSWGVVDTAPMGIDATKVLAVGQVPGGKVQVQNDNPPL
jgi:hypothetical protein